MSTTDFPAATPHGDLRELFPDLFFVTGSVRMMPGMVASRNMVVARDGDSLTLINSLRLDDDGLAALDQLGNVEHVIRLAGFHGMDDPFYKDRYNADVWVVKDQVYAKGFSAAKESPQTYFEADHHMTPDTELPIADAQLFCFESAVVPEALLVIPREGGIVISGDCLQHWHKSDRYFSTLAKVAMKLMGFLKPHNIGPGWLKAAKPKADDVRRVLDLDFDHVLPVHGEEVIGGAKDKYRAAFDRL